MTGKRKRSSAKNGKILKKHKKVPKAIHKKLLKNKANFVKRQLDKGDGTNVVATYQRKKGRSVGGEGRSKKKIKVSKILRQKIQKVMDKDQCQGWYKEIACVSDPIPLLDNLQSVAYLHPVSPGNEVAPFSPVTVLNAASVLWNGLNPSSFGGSGSDGGNFFKDTLKLHLVESNIVYNIKNNTARGIHIKIYDCSPKSAAGQNDDFAFDPIQYWTGSLVNQIPSGDDTGSNPLSNTINTLGNSPKMCQAFTKMFAVDETIVYLEAGKEYYHRVRGTKDMLYDYAKYFMGGQFSNFQKMGKYSFICAYVDLVAQTGTAGDQSVGRVTTVDVDAGYGILCEASAFYRVRVPEQAGLKIPTLPVAGQNIGLNNRRNAYAIKNFSEVSMTPGAPIIIQDENPFDNTVPTGAV